MSEKLKKIIEIVKMANNAEEVEILTNSFKAKGELFKNKEKTVEGIVTLKNVKICEPAYDYEHECECEEDECGCGSDIVTRKWLNIFEDQIVAFTAIGK